MTARLMQVVFCDELRRGSGKDSTSPVRRVTQYWSTDGQLLAECDPCSKVVPIEDDPEQWPNKGVCPHFPGRQTPCLTCERSDSGSEGAP